MVNFDRLTKLTKKKGLSLSYLSTSLGLNRFYLNNCKDRNTEIPDARLNKIAELLGTTVAYLTDETDDDTPTGETELAVLLDQFRYRPECQILFSTLQGASADDVMRAVRIIDALKKTDDN